MYAGRWPWVLLAITCSLIFTWKCTACLFCIFAVIKKLHVHDLDSIWTCAYCDSTWSFTAWLGLDLDLHLDDLTTALMCIPASVSYLIEVCRLVDRRNNFYFHLFLAAWNQLITPIIMNFIIFMIITQYSK